MGDSLGKSFIVTCFGESHGRCVGVVVEGCPAGLPIDTEDIQREVDRRRPMSTTGSTSRSEEDRVEVLSGVFRGHATGAPIAMLVWNRDADSSAYEKTRLVPRPAHADYTAYIKYGGFNDFRGGGRFSGRLTAGFVMAGAIARKMLSTCGTEIIAHTIEIGGIKASPQTTLGIRERAGRSPVRCADANASERMIEAIERAREAGDSLGGIIEALALNVPAGLGEPIFDTVEGEIAKALFAIPAVKGVEFGAGFAGAARRGSENNDPFAIENGKIVTLSNNSGGILGGISNGMPITMRVAIKPTPSISLEQRSVNIDSMSPASLSVKGRHDACIVPRAVPVVESMLAITLADLALRAQIIPRVIR